MPVLNQIQIIKRVTHIGLQEKQGHKFCFLNRSKEPYEWTDIVPEDGPEYQGLVVERDARFPDISAGILGVLIERGSTQLSVCY